MSAQGRRRREGREEEGTDDARGRERKKERGTVKQGRKGYIIIRLAGERERRRRRRRGFADAVNKEDWRKRLLMSKF